MMMEMESKVEETRREGRDKHEIVLNRIKTDGLQKLKSTIQLCREQELSTTEKSKSNVMFEMEKTQELKVDTLRAQAVLNRETELCELRSRMESQTAKALSKIMESLAKENVEYLRLQRVTIENQLRDDHAKRLSAIKEEATRAMKAEEQRIRTSLMADHTEQEW